ncbi:hypothetical protein DWB61_17305 [Ancylomarina euxinus]|uniref:Uncharacterized protein n=1 Tax=Ancylomarina euxinus TaxID=2283627 RepID=A0A425XWH5_9BACT|nr:hypothetical protein [Ancylomarina euxinus]MCZ4696428.1 hypothetical protein [Ancylomarina euxinus]MUP16801.1 hypothetical protein [Ancylomarina euxinus]RRG18999.1 hypothetical protein DWB61_17305 [Ancylomarina euxinus]
MEFNGFIYTYKNERKFLEITDDPNRTEFAIKGHDYEKFQFRGTWIVSTNYNYLKTINLRPYIVKSNVFAKILISTKEENLKFDFLENGKFKKQIIIKNGVVVQKFGISEDISNLTFLEITNNLLRENIHLSLDELDSGNNNFKNQNYSRPSVKKSTIWVELYLLSYIPRIVIFIVFSPILSFFLIKVLISAIGSGEIETKYLIILILILLIFLAIPAYFSILAFKEIKNYVLLKTRLHNDDKFKNSA